MPIPPPSGRLRALARVFATLAVGLTGCASAPPQPASSPPASREEEARSAEADLARAEGELAAALGATRTGEADAAQRAVPSSSPAPTRDDEERSPPGGEEPERPCAVACRALSSMTRAAERLCDLAGSTDARCRSARVRVEQSAREVHARCPACR